MPSCFNTTEPLVDFENKPENNKIYEFSPEKVKPELPDELDGIDESRHLKKVKSFNKISNPMSCTAKNSMAAKFNIPRISSNLSQRKRNRRPVIKLANIEQLDVIFNEYKTDLMLSDSEFSFTSSSDSDLDLESLPDLVDDNNTPISSPKNPVTPNDCFLDKPARIFDSYDDIHHIHNQNQKSKVQLKLEEQLEIENQNISSTRTSFSTSIFEIPEIAYKIIEFAAIQNDNSPKEVTPVRRKPLSFNHALLIHGNKELARKSMEDLNPEYSPKNRSNILYNCLFVNKLFNSIANEILSKKICFDDETKLVKYAQSEYHRRISRPNEISLHKLFNLKASHLESTFSNFDFINLRSIEIFMCPKFLPPEQFYQYGNKIKKLVICGSKLLDDNYLMMISQKCPNLEILDIRGCELVTDSGIYHLGQNCRKLTVVNLGRKTRGNLITDAGIHKLIVNNCNLNTVGLAGCHITDKTIWDLTINNSHSLQRLSINNCPYITNQSIPLILHADYLPSLNVLEIRFTSINNLRPIIEFKRRQEFRGISVLIELCESLCLIMRQQELEMDKAISQRIFNDIQDWANDNNDGDSCYLTLLNSRTQMVS